MSHHFDSPTGREDPRINLCDLFVFAGEVDSTVLIMTVNPDAGLSSPTTLRPDALYEFKIDLDGDSREDLAIRFVVESPEGGPQRVRVLRAAGEPARTGSDGAPLGAGSAGEAIALAGGGRAWLGLASDPFRVNGPALRAFFKAIDEGRFDATSFDRQVDEFAGRNVTALVVELPSRTLAAPTIGVWSEVSLYGHAPQRRVARAAWPLIKHVLVRDEHARVHLNEDPPSSDPATASAAAIANVARVTRLAGTTADPEAYARRLASIVLPDILPYRPASVASFGFASINGRALGDAASDVVFTLLANRPLAGTRPADRAANARDFPYLARSGYFADHREIRRSWGHLRAWPLRRSAKTPPGTALCSRTMFAVVTVLAAALVDLFRSRRSLLTEIALLRHQIAVLQRSVARPHVTRLDRIVLVALAAMTPTWRNVLRVVQPETLLRWHRAGFKALWRWRSRPRPALRITAETVALIRTMARENALWGAERLRGELLKLGIKASKRTVQKYMSATRALPPGRQRWSTFLRNHACDVWACDFLQAYDLFFRPIFTLVFIELATRKVVFAGTTRMPSQPWVAQQLRNATPLGVAPKFLIRDRDSKFGTAFDALAVATGIRVIRTAVRAPNMNAICERFLGSLRRECLDHILVLDDRHLHRVVAEYIRYFNATRPHQGLRQETPVPAVRPPEGNIVALPVLGGLHHDYRRVA